MAKILEKTQRVIDFQLTPYGKHRLSVGGFKPDLYAFFDTGVLYDSKYAQFDERQNNVHERIKNKTQYIEGILSFEEVENTSPESEYLGVETPEKASLGGEYAEYIYTAGEEYGDTGIDEFDYFLAEVRAAIAIKPGAPDPDTLTDKEALEYLGFVYIPKASTNLFDLDIVPKRFVPTPNVLSFESSIGDAKFEGENTQAAPAWKLLTCQGEIHKVTERDTSHYDNTEATFDIERKEFNIPQIDINANYTLEISSPTQTLDRELPSEFVTETQQFVGGNTIKLIRNDVVVYAEEANTELLTENFDIEVFEMIEDSGTSAEESSGNLECLNPFSAGDTVTIYDGVTTVVFEFVANTNSAIKAFQSAHGDYSGRVGVIVSNGYTLDGSSANRKGTLYNLMSAINMDAGRTDDGYPTNPKAPGSGSRCLFRARAGRNTACVLNKHSLRVRTSIDSITRLKEHSFTSEGSYNIRLVNDNVLYGNPNQKILTSVAAEVCTPTGFEGGHIKKGLQLKRKYFAEETKQIVDGLMVSANKEQLKTGQQTKDSVEYYFNVLTDSDVDAKIACSCASTFNRNSYYVDIDFDCVEEEIESIYYDIYGTATVPEICEDTQISQRQAAEDTTGGFAGLTPREEACED